MWPRVDVLVRARRDGRRGGAQRVETGAHWSWVREWRTVWSALLHLLLGTVWHGRRVWHGHALRDGHHGHHVVLLLRRHAHVWGIPALSCGRHHPHHLLHGGGAPHLPGHMLPWRSVRTHGHVGRVRLVGIRPPKLAVGVRAHHCWVLVGHVRLLHCLVAVVVSRVEVGRTALWPWAYWRRRGRRLSCGVGQRAVHDLAFRDSRPPWDIAVVVVVAVARCLA
jgi:hypothetical protein